MIQLLTQPTLGSASFQQPAFQAMYHSESAQYAKGGPLTADYNQPWPGRAFVPNVSNRPGLPDGSLGSFTPECNMQSTSNEEFYDRNVYHNNFLDSNTLYVVDCEAMLHVTLAFHSQILISFVDTRNYRMHGSFSP